MRRELKKGRHPRRIRASQLWRLTVRAAWVAGCISLLLVLLGSAQASSAEASLPPLAALLLLTAPLGWLGMYLASEASWLVLQSLGMSAEGVRVRLVFEGGGAIVLGYLQWFVLIPYFTARLRRRAQP